MCVVALLTRLNLFINLLHHWSDALKSISPWSRWTTSRAIIWMSLFDTSNPLFRLSRTFWYTSLSIWGYITVRVFFINPGGPASLLKMGKSLILNSDTSKGCIRKLTRRNVPIQPSFQCCNRDSYSFRKLGFRYLADRIFFEVAIYNTTLLRFRIWVSLSLRHL